MSEPGLAEIRDEALAIARDASHVLMRGYRKPKEVQLKSAIDLVTNFDLESEALIRERIAQSFPTHAIVAEEGAPQGSGELVWYVDPIDGTTNYAHGHPFFCVSIALCRGPEPLVGVVLAPALGVTWTAARGLGATRNDEPCRVSTTAVLREALCATGFPYDRATSEENNFAEFIALKKAARGVRRCGSAALDLALVADGTYDAYWEQKLKPWDLAAGALLVLEAGGRVTDYDGGQGDVRSGRLLATNGALHETMMRTLAQARSNK